MGAQCSCNTSAATIGASSLSGLLHSVGSSFPTPTLDGLDGPSSLLGSPLAAHIANRYHPYTCSHVPTNRSLHGPFRTHCGTMGNHHGKVTINGETYDTHKIHQTFLQMKADLDSVKVSIK